MKKRSDPTAQTQMLQRELREIFKVDRKFPDRLASHESSSVEFKESFNFKAFSRYAKTMAAYANCKGGLIIFGVKNNPRTFPGLVDKKLEAFSSLDPERVTTALNDNFAPEIRWKHGTHTFKGRNFGYIYTFEAAEKPVIASRNFGEDVSEGAIYYRYGGKTQLIRFPELRQIMDEVKEREQRLWIRQIVRIAKVGIRNVGIFDFKTGMTTDMNGRSFLLDESVLGKIAFIKEGEFSEVKGKPTLRVIGDVEGVNMATVGTRVERVQGIGTANIICDFLQQKKISDGMAYVRQICRENSATLPCYYYIFKSGKSIGEALKEIKAEISRAYAKDMLINRLEKGKLSSKKYALTGSSKAAVRKSFTDAILSGKVPESLLKGEKGILRFFEAVLNMTSAQVAQSEKLIREKLYDVYVAEYETMESSMSSWFRRTVCWVDESLYLHRCKEV